MNQLKNRELLPQFHFATLTHDNQIKPVLYLVKHETVLSAQKDDSRPILVDFGNDQFSIRNDDSGEKIIIKPRKFFSFEYVNPF